jgi:type II secretory ATPase GspE/PulE/Tfp pilus assembly ATPase PilB-like protein
MSIEPYLITGAVECFIAQRLVRILCVHCRRRSTVIVELQSSFPFLNDCDLGAIIFEAQGCERCRFTGYQGREAIYEILPMSDRLRDLIIKRSSLEDLRRIAIEGGMKLLRQSGWEKIRLGKTSCAEILRVTQEDVAS